MVIQRIVRKVFIIALPVLTVAVVAYFAANDAPSAKVNLQAANRAKPSTSAVIHSSPTPSSSEPAEVVQPDEDEDTPSQDSTSKSSTNSSNSTRITVNGKDVTLPASGDLHKTYADGQGTTRLDVDVDNQQNSSSTSNSSIDVQINSDTSSSFP
ncbi:MAG: hypothetical protein JWN82_100 [Candidatus Saccharibacteria bacterium]|nr:hypothetical protein [Candidatus Saccharibacteria bacterium]